MGRGVMLPSGKQKTASLCSGFFAIPAFARLVDSFQRGSPASLRSLERMARMKPFDPHTNPACLDIVRRRNLHRYGVGAGDPFTPGPEYLELITA